MRTEAVMFSTLAAALTLPLLSIELLGVSATLTLGVIAAAIAGTSGLVSRSKLPRARTRQR